MTTRWWGSMDCKVFWVFVENINGDGSPMLIEYVPQELVNHVNNVQDDKPLKQTIQCILPFCENNDHILPRSDRTHGLENSN